MGPNSIEEFELPIDGQVSPELEGLQAEELRVQIQDMLEPEGGW